MKKQYRLTYADGYEMKVEIDHSILTEEKLHELNNFWSNAESRLIRCTVLDAVLKMLCSTFMAESVERFDPVAAFNSGEIEGWPPLDGSWGIKLLDYDPFEFESDLVDVLEITS
jgi:hypothetical protein